MNGTSAVLDLRGEVCPYTFVKTRLALEDLVVGQEIALLLDNPESATRVPRSLERDGQVVLEVTEEEPGRLWRVRVRKVRA